MASVADENTTSYFKAIVDKINECKETISHMNPPSLAYNIRFDKGYETYASSAETEEELMDENLRFIKDTITSLIHASLIAHKLDEGC